MEDVPLSAKKVISPKGVVKLVERICSKLPKELELGESVPVAVTFDEGALEVKAGNMFSEEDSEKFHKYLDTEMRKGLSQYRMVSDEQYKNLVREGVITDGK